MPFKSEAQRKFMYAKHPEIAKKWSHEFPNQGKLPEHKSMTAEEMHKKHYGNSHKLKHK